jgi:hypothetical protein
MKKLFGLCSLLPKALRPKKRLVSSLSPRCGSRCWSLMMGKRTKEEKKKKKKRKAEKDPLLIHISQRRPGEVQV